GAISSWDLEFPSAVRAFDYDTITDVVIHLSYTAGDGGGTLKETVNGELESALNDLKTLLGESGATLARLFSLRQEFAADWNRFLSSTTAPQQITLNFGKQHFPRFLDYMWGTEDGKPKPIILKIDSVSVYLNPKGMMPDVVD